MTKNENIKITVQRLFDEIEELFEKRVYIGRHYNIEFLNLWALYSESEIFEILYFDELKEHCLESSPIDWEEVTREMLQLRSDLLYKKF